MPLIEPSRARSPLGNLIEPWQLDQVAAAVAALEVRVPDRTLLDLVAALARLMSAAAAAQMRAEVAFADSRTRQDEESGVPAARCGASVACELALVRRESPASAARHLGAAQALVCEMPATLESLARGEVSEWGAVQIVAATATLRRVDRAVVDQEVAPRLGGWSTRRAIVAVRTLAQQLDPEAAAARASAAAADRRVWIRPAPDCMTYLTALLPVREGVSVYAALRHAAAAARASGKPATGLTHSDTTGSDPFGSDPTGAGPTDGDRTRGDLPDRDRAKAGSGRPPSLGQLMADTLVERVTGRAMTDPVPITVDLVMTDTTLLPSGRGGDQGPAVARVAGYGPVPAPLARRLAASDRVFLRRLYTAPGSGELVAMDSRARVFPSGLAQLITLRDQVCRVPFCDAPIRHLDHVVAHHRGGKTAYANGQGLCERHNQAKEHPAWDTRQRASASGRIIIELTTPTGMTYSSTAPPPLGVGSDHAESPIERHLRRGAG